MSEEPFTFDDLQKFRKVLGHIKSCECDTMGDCVYCSAVCEILMNWDMDIIHDVMISTALQIIEAFGEEELDEAIKNQLR